MCFWNPQIAWFWGSSLLGAFSCTTLEWSARDLKAVSGHFLRLYRHSGLQVGLWSLCITVVFQEVDDSHMLTLAAGRVTLLSSWALPASRTALCRRSPAPCPAECVLQKDPFIQACCPSGSCITRQIDSQTVFSSSTLVRALHRRGAWPDKSCKLKLEETVLKHFKRRLC